MSSVMPAYARFDLEFERGEGAWLYTASGERYLDFASGVAVTALGHAHPRLQAALCAQAGRLWHCSNLYRIPGQAKLAERLCAESFADLAFFVNSGSEAVETCVKAARIYHARSGDAPVSDPDQRHEIISFEGAFHGRSLAMIAAGGQDKHLRGFGPRVSGFRQVPLNDIEAVAAAIGPRTAAIMLEPVQGEGGIHVAEPGFVAGLRALCDQHGLLLIFDEVQTGIGRTGTLFAHQRYAAEGHDVQPDLMALAKGLGSGFPVGACLATRDAARGMVPGTHGSTFGGNPLAMAVATEVLDIMTAPGFMDHVQKMAAALAGVLDDMVRAFPALFSEWRGTGLMLGLKAIPANGEMIAALQQEHLLTVGAGDNIIRLLPPLIITDHELAEARRALYTAAAQVNS